jgi:branched-subunit amino acid transport protein
MSHAWGYLLVAGAATYVWRFIGVAASRQMAIESPLILWVKSVATALIAALVVRFVYAPSGLLQETAFASRAIALVAAMAGYYALGRRIEAGVGSAALVFVILEGLRSS